VVRPLSVNTPDALDRRMPDVQLLIRNRFHPVRGATARPVAGNAWEIRIPADDPVLSRARRTSDPTTWDDAVFLVDDLETDGAVGSAHERGWIVVTAWSNG